MSARTTVAVAAALGAAGIAAAIGYLAGTRTAQAPAAMSASPARSATAAQAAAPEPARTVLYWYDPMRPEVKFDKPGKSPFMDMQLVPRFADKAAGTGVSIDPRMAQSLGARTAPVVRGTFWQRVDTTGRIEIDERTLASVTVRAEAWVEKESIVVVLMFLPPSCYVRTTERPR